MVGLVDRELEGVQGIVPGVAAPAQKGAGTAGAVKGEGVPDQLRLGGGGVDAAEHGPIPLHTGGGQLNLLGDVAELLVDPQTAPGEPLPGPGTEGKGDLLPQRHRPEGGLEGGVAGKENGTVEHIWNLLLRGILGIRSEGVRLRRRIGRQIL